MSKRRNRWISSPRSNRQSPQSSRRGAHSRVTAADNELDIIVEHAVAETEHADPSGQVGGTRQVVYDRSNLGRFDSLEAVVNSLPAFTPSADEFMAMPGDKGRLTGSTLVTEDNLRASQREIEAWREGRKDLWNLDLDLYVRLARTWKPNADELQKHLEVPY